MSKIYLAVGHGQSMDGTWDPGCTYRDLTEAELMYAIAGAAVSAMRKSGITVLTDYDTGNNMNMTATVQAANDAGVDAYLALHCDYKSAPSGILPIIYPGSAGGERLARCVEKTYREATGLKLRGILKRDDYEVRATDMPACIFETGSINADLNVLQNALKCGNAIAAGVADYFNLKSTPLFPTDKAATPAPCLKIGSRGDAVTILQRDLAMLNYRGADGNPPDADGIFGENTRYAVCCLQRFHHLSIDGIYGECSHQALKAEVKTVQNALNRAGATLDADGITGTLTLKALKAFQKRKGLTVDAIAGPMTLKALGIG